MKKEQGGGGGGSLSGTLVPRSLHICHLQYEICTSFQLMNIERAGIKARKDNNAYYHCHNNIKKGIS